MEAKLEDLVVALLQRFSDSTEEVVHPSQVFGVAHELVRTMSAAERHRQLHRILSLIECLKEGCTVALIVSSAALGVSGASNTAVCNTEADVKKWELLARSIITYHQLPKHVLKAVCFCIARVTLISGSSLLLSIGETLRRSYTGPGLPVETAAEVLAHLADMLIGIGSKYEEPKGEAPKDDAITGRKGWESIADIQSVVVSCALDAISSMGTDVELVTFLCRRVLTPLLLRVDQQPSGSDYARVLDALLYLYSEKAKHCECLVIVTALFEYLFRFRDCDVVRDYRCSPHLWETLQKMLWESIASDSDAGGRLCIQRRAEYLLKRIVNITYQQELDEGRNQNICFHPYFVWVPGASSIQWGMFFLVLEATNEYGLHIVEPALPKFDVLIERLAHDASAWEVARDNMDSFPSLTGSLHPLWIELLFLKMLLHPNVALRKIGLARLWSVDAPLLRLLSSEFLFTIALDVSLDTRLCTEVDRALYLPTVVDSKGFEGDEVPAVSNAAGPLVCQMESFYPRIFRHVMRDAHARREALRRMLHCVATRPSVHSAAVVFRLLHRIVTELMCEDDETSRRATAEMITNDEVLREFTVVLRGAAQDRVPFWIDVRLSAMVFRTLLLFAQMDVDVVCQCAAFWKLLCACGPLGNSGGCAVFALESVAHVGTLGVAIDPRFHNEQLLHVSSEAQLCGDRYSFMRKMLRADKLLDRVRVYIQSNNYDEVQGKQLMFLCGALDGGDVCDRELLTALACEVSEAILSFSRRPYSSLSGFLNALLAFVEFHHSVGSLGCTRYFPPSTIVDMGDAIYTLALGSLRQSQNAISALARPDDFAAEIWALQHVLEWDTLVAALVASLQTAVCHESSTVVMGLRVEERISEVLELIG
ncbi:hypothetical protein, conserved, partial [Trypanosoma vivax Y486]